MLKTRAIWISAGLALLVFAVYARVARHEFIIYDDPDYITENRVVQEGLTAKGIAWAFGNLHGERTYWHPLTWVSHMIDTELFGLNPAGHHLVNVMFHALNAILLFLLFRQLTGALWRSAIVAALFAVHPVQVDTVAWVTERKNVLSTLFWILSTMAYVRYARQGRWSNYALTVVLFALGLMCKPALVTLPFVFLLLDYWPLKRWITPTADSQSPFRFSSAWPLIAEKLPLFAMSAASSWITAAAHKGIGMTSNIYHLPLLLRIENAIVSYARYLSKAIWPADLSIIYPHPGAWPRATVILSALVLLAITWVVIANLKRRPYLAVGWFWFLGVLVPAIGLVQVGYQAMADRFAYVPLIGLFLMFVWQVGEWALAQAGRAWLPRVLVAAALAGYAIATWFQLGHWKNTETLFTHVVKVTKRNYVAHLNLATHYALRGQTNGAVTHALEAIRANSRGHEPFLILGLAREWGRDTSGAISNYHRALAMKPDWHPARKSLATALALQGDLPNAEAEFLKLLEATPRDPEVPTSLALIYMRQQKPELALQYYRRALELSPNSPAALNNIAWLLATYPDAKFRDGAEAVRHAERACQLTQRKIPTLLGTLAAAYAEAGRFEDAIRTAEEARDLAQKTGAFDTAQTNAKLLELYRAKKPYREGQPL